MSRYETRGVLAGAYLRGDDRRAYLTHVYDTTTRTVLCGKVKPDNTSEDPHGTTDFASEATCKTCARRDPRRQNGPDDGPRALKHIFQF